MFWLVGWIFFGFVIGLIARGVVPGPQPMGCLGTIVLGIGGSFAGGIPIGRWGVAPVQRLDRFNRGRDFTFGDPTFPTQEGYRASPRENVQAVGSVN